MSVRAPRLSDTLVNVRNLAVEFRAGSSVNRAVKVVSFNIGRGVETSLLDLIEALAPHAPNGFEPEFAPERPGEVRHIAIDPTRARAELDWTAQVGLEDGIERTLASLR